MSERLLVFVGCLNREAPYFQGARGKGIAVFAFDEANGEAVLLSETDDLDNPTFLSIDPARRTLYASSEVFNRKEGAVASYRFDPDSGRLDYLGMQPSRGSICAYNALSGDGRFLLLANYGMGEGGPDRSVVVFPIGEDGSLAPPIAGVRHEGTGPDAARQERPHPHCVRDIDGRGHLLVADLGIDRLVSYRLSTEGELTREGETALAPGAGPRHIAVRPGDASVFCVNELDSTVQSFRHGPDGALRSVSVRSAVPEGTAGNYCADLHLSPDGRFLYASNRGHDSIATFAVDPATAALESRGQVSSLGATPRSFCLTPSGRHLLVANQDSDEIVVFRRDARNGALEATGRRLAVGTPMCVRAIERPDRC